MLKHRVSNAGMQNQAAPTSSLNPTLKNAETTITASDPIFPPIPPEASHYASAQEMPSQQDDNAMTRSSESKQAVKRLSERYDSIGNVITLPHKSPLGSPKSDRSSVCFSDVIASEKFREGVTEADLLQVDTFYRSHKTEVYVCRCLANIYLGSLKSALSNDQWTFCCTGIPVLVLDTGEHHRERQLYIIIAEKGTGFTLWRETIDNMTAYKAPKGNFHTMHISTDHSKLAGLSFDDDTAAAEFYGHLDKLTSDPSDELLMIGKNRKKSLRDKKKRAKLPKKSEISQPCCFVHVTKLDRPFPNEMTIENQTEASEMISRPFNLQYLSVQTRSGISTSDSFSNLMGSKSTLTSVDSVDSGLSSEDRHVPKNDK